METDLRKVAILETLGNISSSAVMLAGMMDSLITISGYEFAHLELSGESVFPIDDLHLLISKAAVTKIAVKDLSDTIKLVLLFGGKNGTSNF